MDDHQTYYFNWPREDGTVERVQLTAEQTFDFINGKPLTYIGNGEPAIDPDGTLVELHDARRPEPDAAA